MAHLSQALIGEFIDAVAQDRGRATALLSAHHDAVD
jgi:hypothetical protein